MRVLDRSEQALTSRLVRAAGGPERLREIIRNLSTEGSAPRLEAIVAEIRRRRALPSVTLRRKLRRAAPGALSQRRIRTLDRAGGGSIRTQRHPSE